VGRETLERKMADPHWTSIAGTIGGIIGSLTGVVSLIWHILRARSERPRLQISSLVDRFERVSSSVQSVHVNLQLVNEGASALTITDVQAKYAGPLPSYPEVTVYGPVNTKNIADESLPVTIEPGSSRKWAIMVRYSSLPPVDSASEHLLDVGVHWDASGKQHKNSERITWAQAGDRH